MTDVFEKLSNNADPFARRVAILSAVATFLLGAFSAYLNYRTVENQHQIDLANQTLAQQTAAAKQTLEESNFRVSVLKEVKEAITENNHKKQEAVAQFVKSLGESKFQQSMATILADLAESPEAAAIGLVTAAQAELRLDEPSLARSSSTLLGWNVDVFYCKEKTANNERTAQRVSDVLKGKTGNERLGRVRVKALSAALRTSRPYDFKSGNVILQKEGKEEQARQLRDWLKNVPELREFDIVDGAVVDGPYLSAYVCVGA
jgi:hypothetical protein